jgi:hypothetical protein
MIWYACKKCGKRHGKPENLSGTLVFCECGTGNRVPWSSTAPEPEVEEKPAPVPVPVPPSRPARPSIPVPSRDEREPRRGRDDEPLPPFRPRPRREYRRVNAKFCLNHDELPTEFTCAHCHLPFCGKCVLELQGERLCGPCKNFKVRGMQRPSRLTPLAIGAAVVALVAGSISFCLTSMGATQGSNPASIFFGVVAVLPPIGALVLGLWAMKEVETKARTGGRALALTGLVGGALGVLWSFTAIMVMIMKLIQQ